MPVVSTVHDWIPLPSGLFVSNGRMQKDGKIFTLYEASTMDVVAFNKKGAEYDVHMEEADAPIDRLVKYSIFLARMNNDGAFMPTNAGYVDMLLDVAAAKARGAAALASFYKPLTTGPPDTTRELLEFHEKLPKGKYKTTLLRFNVDGELEPIDDITVAGEGWTKALGAKYKYPVETDHDVCVIENIDNPMLSGTDIKGYWYVGSDPVGQQQVVIRVPLCTDGGLFRGRVCGDRFYSRGVVTALRLRDSSLEDHATEATKRPTKAYST